MEPKAVVGANIRRLRTEAGMTQEELAAASEMHPVQIGRAERGVKDLRVSTLVRIARGLGVGPDALLAGLESAA